MIGIVDVGGGMRGVFGCGVTDFLLDNDITFDYCLGVSAGSANLASYVSSSAAEITDTTPNTRCVPNI